MVDLEPRVLNEICNYDLNQYSDLFDVDNIYQGPTGGGAGNKFVNQILSFKFPFLAGLAVSIRVKKLLKTFWPLSRAKLNVPNILKDLHFVIPFWEVKAFENAFY